MVGDSKGRIWLSWLGFCEGFGGEPGVVGRWIMGQGQGVSCYDEGFARRYFWCPVRPSRSKPSCPPTVPKIKFCWTCQVRKVSMFSMSCMCPMRKTLQMLGNNWGQDSSQNYLVLRPSATSSEHFGHDGAPSWIDRCSSCASAAARA